MDKRPTVAVIMGVSGSGKSTLGKLLSERLRWAFQEGDDLHTAPNIDKLKSGLPLDDQDRWPWLAKVRDWIDRQITLGQPGVITCSALKLAYRQYLKNGQENIRLVYLAADERLTASRLAARKGHFMLPGLLASQFYDLEPPTVAELPIVIEPFLPLFAKLEQLVDALG